jgi:hypothetical protein
MMSEKQMNFRKDYRSRIAGWYNGHVHALVIYTIGLTALYIYSQHLSGVLWWEWLTIPIIVVICNMFEWFLHMHVMHRPRGNRGLRAIYIRHTLNHHQFFSDHEMRFRDQKDWRVTLFPPYAMVVFILMAIPFAFLGGYLISANVGWLMMCSTTGMYLIYEFMHFCCHIDENSFVRYCPLVNTLRRHHTAHHNSRLMMEVNMNLTFPISDWMFGTSDLDRGLLGHLFNGYSTRHLKKNLKGQPMGPVEAAAEPLAAEFA